jgi:hypothetical protein
MRISSDNRAEIQIPSFEKRTLVTKKAEPFIKWAGGKQALIPQLVPHFAGVQSARSLLQRSFWPSCVQWVRV